MYDRKQLVHSVFWPAGRKAVISLIDNKGVVCGEMKLERPIKGSELASMIPEGLYLSASECTLVSMSGKQVVATKAPFDTAVVTERAEVTFEERMARLERREMRRAKRERQREEEHQRMLAEMREQREGGEVVEDDIPPGDVDPAGELTEGLEDAGGDDAE